ncbi:telomere repeats-binding bouquet formation protein 1-like [Xyrauchen texanus]|uniref:telomere repeats-binding bouquet formation protein 1-like n=1 Tax=Xyrauchen texanus TaxID=154827 RepID=UPI0022427624|nr:telomere repeats-binding bouquet formation protein 1-like [Xyrauchen texanus]
MSGSVLKWFSSYLSAIKTYLRLLLECLKYQMTRPDSQKQALLTIFSICQKNSQYVEFFREIGGISFIYNLSKSSSYSEVKETALFTLASFAELHESCKQTLCREETFCDLAVHLKQEMPLTQKRVAVYMLSVLVANNRRGQTFAKTSSCIETLLSLFRHSFPGANDCSEQLQFWATVSSALCGSVNNPQNEENQNVCMRAFPLVKTWLQEVTLARVELAQPVCSFIGMTVANNFCAQEYFVSMGGLDSLSSTLTRVLPQSAHSATACKMATIIIKTLSACISNNERLVSFLSNLRIIPGLLCLLSSPILVPQDQLAVVLTIGHLTDACVKHQSQLLLAGGLPLMISLLTEACDEEVRKAAMFVLHTCKKITESLGRGVPVQDEVESDIERYRESAREILQRIQQLEKKIGEKQWDRGTESQRHSMQRSASSVECNEEWWEDSVIRKVKVRHRVCEELLTTSPGTPDQPITSQRPYIQESLVSIISEECLSPSQVPFFQDSILGQGIEREQEQLRENKQSSERIIERCNDLETRRGGYSNKIDVGEKRKMRSERVVKRLKMMALVNQDSENERHKCNTPTGDSRDTGGPHIFRHPDPMKRGQCIQTHSNDEISLCSELLDKEIKRFLKPLSTSTPGNLRCAGCMNGMHEVDSRLFGAVMHCCRYKCDFHLVLLEVENRFRRSQQLVRASHSETHAHINTHGKSREHNSCTNVEKERESHGLSHHFQDGFLSLTPLRRPCEAKGSNMEKKTIYRNLEKMFEARVHNNSSGKHRERRNWTADELLYLSEGVTRFGHSWNSILWAYPFQPGRTNVDLAKKYQRMQKAKAQGIDLYDTANL